MSESLEAWVEKTKQWNDSTKMIHALVHEDLRKSKLLVEPPKRSYNSTFIDPYNSQDSMGYKERVYSLSYDHMKRISRQLSIVAAILATRCNQVASFSAPFKNTNSLGYQIGLKKAHKSPTSGEREKIHEIEQFISRCGAKQPNPHSKFARDNFETFLRKIVRDSLTFDALTFEVVPDRRGNPYEFMAVDASTIRIASTRDGLMAGDSTYHNRPPVANNPKLRLDEYPFNAMKLFNRENDKDRPDYVQLVNGQIHTVYTGNELYYGVRNPRTDIYANGYGHSELEQLITCCSALLNSEEYNRRIFTNGSSPKGIISIKGDAMSADQLEGFKREWFANLQGTHNAHKTPIMQSELGVDFIKTGVTNQEMEFSQWQEYNLKIACAVFLIDPEELNFSLSKGGQQNALFESDNEHKLKNSKDKGLKPLLRFIAKAINDNIVDKLGDDFVFDFIGLDELSESQKLENRKTQVTLYKTLNETRKEADLPPIEHGDIVLNPTYLQGITIDQQKQAQDAQASGSQAQAVGDDAEGSGTPPEETKTGPSYTDSFSKSVGNRYLEISIDDWKQS